MSVWFHGDATSSPPSVPLQSGVRSPPGAGAGLVLHAGRQSAATAPEEPAALARPRLVLLRRPSLLPRVGAAARRCGPDDGERLGLGVLVGDRCGRLPLGRRPVGL